ncbi:MAG: hypothetical protein GTN73_01650 [Candidatus Aminicenantes bacterium]|nr:hypothetical protein [Candidatus Aminicenantes bacterium]
MSNKRKIVLRSGAKGSLFLVLCWLLFVVPSLYFLFVSSSFSVERSVFNEEKVLAKEQENSSNLEWKAVSRITVLGSVDWTDTGLEVKEDQEIYFSAQNQISLQRGNPMAWCGPDGMDRKTMQQPISDENIGALIGKVVWLISIEVDEETGEEMRHEIIEKFYIGSANQVRMPISGRLFLGINENVVGDNSGEFEVIIYLPLYP